MKQERILAWHFLRDNGRTQFGDIEVKKGQVYRADGMLELCRNGMHASVKAIDALNFANGALISRVEIRPPYLIGNDKLCGRARKVLWIMDVTALLYEFACREALRALRKANVTDIRCYDAIATRRLWLAGKASGSDLNSAWAAAWAAAGAEARAASTAAATYAVTAVATAAARAAARAEATAAATAAEWDAQNKRLEKMILTEAKKRGIAE